MQTSRREFAKKTAIVAAVGSVAIASTNVLAASAKSVQDGSNNGVVVGSSKKQEILYKKTATWEEYYKSAK